MPNAAFCQKCGAPTGAPPQAPEPSVLDRLTAALADRYRIQRELGKGGMATVFLAHDLRHERDVAIKVLHPELAASLGAERFEREIRVSAKLQHPHILSLFDSGTGNGLFYYVMPFVQGESLRDRLDREQMLPVDDAIGITLEVADALGHAHGLGIVHRDIKPENIMLSGGHALVTDFGIARAVSAAGQEQKLTQTGTAVGTPLYMSPEQAYGDEVGPTSDLYSLACVSYEMLTGQPPFTGSNARAIMARHTMEAVPSIRIVRDAVPEEVEEAILAAMAKVPADRPQTSAEFMALLGTPLGATSTRRAAASRYISKPRVTAAMRRVPVWRRTPVLVGAGAALVLAAAATFYGLRARRAAAADAGGLDRMTIAVLYFEDRSQGGALGYLADGLTEGLIGALREVRELKVISASGSAQYRGTSVPLDSIARALGAGTLVRGSVEPAGANVRVTVRLVEGNTGADFGEGASIERPASEALSLVDSLVQQVAGLVRTRLGEGIRVRQQQQGTRNADAWVLVQRAERARKLLDSAAAAGDTIAVARDAALADSLLAAAEHADARWPEPMRLRGLVAYRRSRLYVNDPTAAGRWIQTGLGHVNRALQVAPRDPDALELRGNLRYWRWLLGLEADPVRSKALLDSAKADLETATTINPAQAGAWSTLSHLYYQTGTASDVNIAARRALEEDAFLTNADVVLQRLFFSSYDLGQFPQAAQWCTDGHRRFPANPKFIECQLWTMTTSARDPDPTLARTLADSMVRISAAPDRPFTRLQSNLLVAAVLARAGRADSARALTRASTGDPVVDPSRDLTHVAAFVYTLLGDTTRAVDQLKTYLAANPSHREGLADDPGWWFRPIAAAPAFRQLVGSTR